MTDFATLITADRGQAARPIHLVDKASFADWLKRRPADDRALLEAQRFTGKADSFTTLPRGNEFEVVAGVKSVERLSPWCIAKLAEDLPEGSYRLVDREPATAALGWLLGQHRFDNYRSKDDEPPRGPRVLLTGDAVRISETAGLAEATALVRDLVNTPAADLGPAELEQAARDLASSSGAQLNVFTGPALADGFPLIAAVGGAAAAGREPRLIELNWGKPDHPRVAIVGKGVCFDSGGLDLKPASGMRLMKKDMGGAAHALALARLVIAAKLPLQLQLLIPAVENAVAGNAYRPGDIVKSRKGLFVEIDNTDAEGRLILADALTLASEAEPELIVDFATLTGAARVALGPDLPAFFTNDEELASKFANSAQDVEDPLWRMPLWDPYAELLKSDVADLANASNTPMAGCITAAMFLKRFIPDGVAWAHFDTYAWRDQSKAGRPKGGEALGLRASYELLKRRYLQQ